jgi:hypothetical protein
MSSIAKVAANTIFHRVSSIGSSFLERSIQTPFLLRRKARWVFVTVVWGRMKYLFLHRSKRRNKMKQLNYESNPLATYLDQEELKPGEFGIPWQASARAPYTNYCVARSVYSRNRSWMPSTSAVGEASLLLKQAH